MCGIAGILKNDFAKTAEADSVRAALEKMRYRGPDALGIFAKGPVAMGNVRLAIQGIDPAGNQPIYNETGSVAVVFNGEIYNFPELRKDLEARGHRFATETDTEVLVHLYEDRGIEMADSLNGMFAFALYDIPARRLLLGRDKTAQKPLFLHRSLEGLSFSSELKSLLGWVSSPKIDARAARDFLSLGYFLEPDCIVQGVESLPPGTVHAYDETARLVATHEIPFPALSQESTRLFPDFETWATGADQVFAEAVRRHTLSDVPVTVFLSGGVDSSLVALYLGQASKVKTVYTGSFSDEESYDEYGFSSALAGQLGLEIRRIDLSKKVLAGSIDAFCASSSQPQGDYSGLPSYVLARETAKDFRVVLGGDGGDELFSGYPTYRLPDLQKKFRFLPAWAFSAAASVARLSGPPKGYLPLRFQLQLVSQAWGKPAPTAHFAVKDFLPPSLVGSILSPEFFLPPLSSAPGVRRFSEWYGNAGDADAVRRLGRLDFHSFLRSCTIPKMERNCMAWSLENRLPFLDNAVLELSANTPECLQRRGKTGKWCLRKLMEKKLGRPPALNPKKQGFGPPLAQMLQKELAAWSGDLLERKHPLFNPKTAATLRSLAARGWDLHRVAWNVCILKDWTDRNGVSA